MRVLRKALAIGAAAGLTGLAIFGGVLNASADDTTPQSLGSFEASSAQQRAVYAIAHRVDTLDGINAAIKHGANAIEVDVCGWADPNEWRTFHDCPDKGGTREGPNLDDWIKRATEQSGPGHKLRMVWLDIKDPDYCGEEKYRGCSVAGLHDKAQKLVDAGIQVLYGFYGYHPGEKGGRGWQSLLGTLNGLEGVSVTGTVKSVEDTFRDHGKGGIRDHQRAMDYGDTDIAKGFGNCDEPSYNTCTELKHGAAERGAGKLGSTFAWTTTHKDKSYVDKLLGTADVDGVIAGYADNTGAKDYADTKECADAIALVRDWVNGHGSTHRMANTADRLFS
ncbi:hypothetical protein [Amycolatopsis sp. CA-230715]|uniref:hypothetical protein n=1 Tax=Amycolatopsis sp. CA-230715 TaxID=2745196 RepID=UPI001C017860|nr:hypothetical protein [Amycolatopsis sp. CA-230715]QWF78956.1 Phospholipase D [Amycolatopsis sp. CA-230715]